MVLKRHGKWTWMVLESHGKPFSLFCMHPPSKNITSDFALEVAIYCKSSPKPQNSVQAYCIAAWEMQLVVIRLKGAFTSLISFDLISSVQFSSVRWGRMKWDKWCEHSFSQSNDLLVTCEKPMKMADYFQKPLSTDLTLGCFCDCLFVMTFWWL